MNDSNSLGGHILITLTDDRIERVLDHTFVVYPTLLYGSVHFRNLGYAFVMWQIWV